MKLKSPELFREQCFIDGKWHSAKSGETMTVHNPSKGTLLGHVPKMGADEFLEIKTICMTGKNP